MPKELTFYHKPTCVTCKKAKAYLGQLGCKLNERDLIKSPPTAGELKALMGSQPVAAFLRKNAPEYKKLVDGKTLPDAALLQLMVKEPNLIKRPIVIAGSKVAWGYDEKQLKLIAS